MTEIPHFSIVVIARNEAATLPKLVKSLREFTSRGGELLLVDTGSTDKTPEIARSLGFIVHEVGLKFVQTITDAKELNDKFVVEGEVPIVKDGDTLFDYSAARNYAAGLASNDMIAMPDCDEVYTRFDVDEIERQIKEGYQQFIYDFVYAQDENGVELIKFVHSKFYDRRVLKWVGVVHEVLHGENTRAIFLDASKLKLVHHQEPSDHRANYLAGLAYDCARHPEKDRNSHYFARELMWCNRPKSAIKEFKRHIAMDKWAPERAQSMSFVGDCYGILGESDRQVSSYQAAFNIDATRREPLLRLAAHYLRRDDHSRVACYATASLQIPQAFTYMDLMSHYREEPHILLYKAFWYLGRKEASRQQYIEAWKYNPKSCLHDRQFYIDLPKITILLPTLNRDLSKVLASITKLNYPGELVETLVLKDEPRIGVPKRIAEGVAQATGAYIVYAADDMEFSPDSVVIAVIESIFRKKGLVAFNTGKVLPDEGNICEHFVIDKTLVDTLGQIFDTDFHHLGVDNLLWCKCKKLDEAYRSNHAIIDHHHFSRGYPMDSCYELAWSHYESDRKLLDKKLAEL